MIDVSIMLNTEEIFKSLLNDNSEEINDLRKQVKPLKKNELIVLILLMFKQHEVMLDELVKTNDTLVELEKDIVLRRSQINRSGRPAISEDIIKEVHKLYEDGWSTRKIGEYLGISKSVVAKYINH